LQAHREDAQQRRGGGSLRPILGSDPLERDRVKSENDADPTSSADRRFRKTRSLRLRMSFRHAFSQAQPVDSEAIYDTKKGGSQIPLDGMTARPTRR
jgi:hypothetical protein